MGRGLSQKTLDLIAAATGILSAIQPATVRGVCYQLFVHVRAIPDMSKNSTDKVSRALTTARERGMIPWDWIVDETREIDHRRGWDDPDAFLHTVRRSYRKDLWAMQPRRVIVVSEKGTVGGVLRPVIHEYGVPLGIYHGFGSATALNDLAAWTVEDGRPATILYVGDHDPSGRYMSDADIPERIARYGGHANIIRLAITAPQIRQHGLPTFSAHEKKTDARYGWFIDNHGETCCELDAMDPTQLRAAVEQAIVGHLDLDQWERAVQVQSVELRSLSDFLAGWPGAA